MSDAPVVTRSSIWRRLNWQRALVSLIAALALFGIGWGFTMHESAPTTLDQDGAIEFVRPLPGSLEQAQGAIVVKFNFGWEGELELNGTPIPDDELTRRDTTGVELTFQPGPEKVFRRLNGDQLVTVRYWRIDESRDQARAYTWRFRTL